MPAWKIKDLALRKSGFKYMIPNSLYVNCRIKKVFSWQYVKRKPLKTIRRNIREKNSTTEMEFYFLKSPTSGVKEYLCQRIRKSRCRGRKLIDKEMIGVDSLLRDRRTAELFM